jgi:hypothetical protein
MHHVSKGIRLYHPTAESETKIITHTATKETMTRINAETRNRHKSTSIGQRQLSVITIVPFLVFCFQELRSATARCHILKLGISLKSQSGSPCDNICNEGHMQIFGWIGNRSGARRHVPVWPIAVRLMTMHYAYCKGEGEEENSNEHRYDKNTTHVLWCGLDGRTRA